MKISDVQPGGARLIDAHDQLQVAWESACGQWNDEARRRFERDQLQSVGPTIRMTLDALTRLADVLARAQQECQDE